MIPSALSAQLQQGLVDFLRFSFWSSTPGMEQVIDDLMAEPGALVKGPYIGVKLPFVTGKDPRFFPEVPLGFTPHAHQERAFDRLGGRRKRSTLIATGTGSGKTESFLLPILNHCRETAGTPGIKAILIYPMNALATDQAGRIARMVHQTPSLQGVRAGLYIGETQGKRTTRETEMGPRHVITDRPTMQESPPDILLTNYKMLDYLLVRPSDQQIWQHNDRGVLRFVVVDELHTFDGAQGTDLACLLRRLKHRLQVDDGSLCCVGTSATLGGPRAADDLRRYAEQVFGEPFDKTSIVGESRISADEFLAGYEVQDSEEPDAEDLEQLDPARATDPTAWLQAQAQLWLGRALEAHAPESDEWRVALGEQLRRHAAFQSLLRLLDGQAVSVDDALQALARRRSGWRKNPELGRMALGSLLGLVSAARVWRAELPEVQAAREGRGEARPLDRFLDIRLQLWQREMRRMVATVGQRPRLAFSDDLDRDQKRRYLPLVHCRDCGAMGWATRRDRDRPHVLRTDLSVFYRAFFRNDSRVAFLFPRAACVGWERPDVLRVDTRTLVALHKDEDPDGEVLELVASENTRVTASGTYLHRDCPFCGARESLTLLGFRAATLTSMYIDQLFASPFNDDKKLLTFSDSVQDAAHRAGFFGARTWRTNLRLAIQQALEATHEGERLSAFARAVARHWQEAMDEPTWVSTFLAPNMAWLHDWDTLREDGRLPEGSDLLKLIEQRLVWEVANEYGLQATIGRSLPRSRSSTAYLDPDALEQAIAKLEAPLQNEVPGLREATPGEIRAFVVGLLHHLRLRGAIHHPEMPGSYLETCGKDTYVFKRFWHLPAFGRTSRLPAFLVDRTGTLRFDTWARSKGAKPGWYERWPTRCFSRGEALRADAGSLYLTALPHLVATGLMWEGQGKKGECIWGVKDQTLRLTARVSGIRCPVCDHRLPIADAELGWWTGIPCLTARCEGRYERDDRVPPDYFGRLYRAGNVQRIYAEEHTGLLTRLEREKVEEQFKASVPRPPGVTRLDDPATGQLWREPWFPNLLSSTPTLEMGIDIGDLSAAVLCSVPPKQANYLQRVGRTGRRDGSSFVLAVANARPHDLYFYAAPTEMLEGEVTPPGVFLDAAAVLERQLAAFCLDCWVGDPAEKASFPDTLREIFTHLTKEKSDHFPHNWLGYIRAREPTLLREFCEMFGDALREHTQQHLRQYLCGSPDGRAGLRWKILDTLLSELKQRNSLQKQATSIQHQIRRLQESEAKPLDYDDQIDALEEEKEALSILVREIDKRRVLELLTDAGFLPNYAFPEAQIRLSSVIWRRKKKVPQSGSKYQTWTHEYRRAPSVALAELAPTADFYAGGRRVSIDQVDIGLSEIETWRFCDACSHAQKVTSTEDPDCCPACGSANWRDAGQKLRMLPLRQVFARSSDRDSRIRDEQDEREPRFFQRELLVDFHEEDREGAWSIQERSLPFGFEYLKRASFRDVNFGEIDDHGVKNTIAGREAVRAGFEICGRCGKVQRPHKPREHTLSCPTRTQNAAEQIEPCLYLYREFSSEALRILLPLTDIGSEGLLHSFVAALQVGLEAQFRGSVDHLRTTVYSEPVEGSALRKQYLVIYDTVPAGTGYLKQLVTRSEKGGDLLLLKVLELARKRLQTCVCWNDPDRQGCYRCLLAYRNSRDMDDVSSRTAVELISRILGNRDKLEQVSSLGDVSITGLVDSVLEARFIEALRQARVGTRPAEIVPAVVRQKPGYRLQIGGNEWNIEPQVEVPQATLGVAVSIDFVLHPRQTKSTDGSAAPARRPIAVFLDGWEYHQERIGWDLLQRQILIASGLYDVWTFTWGDLEAAFHPDRPDRAKNLMHAELQRVRELLQRMGLAAHREVAERRLFETFLGALASPAALPWQDIGRGVIASRMGPAGADAPATWKRLIAEHAPAALRPLLAVDAPKMVLIDNGELDDAVRVYAAYDGDAPTVLAVLDDSPGHVEQPGFNQTWNGFLHLFQLLRFLPGGWFVTTSSADDLPWQHLVAHRHGAGPEGAIWEGIEEVREPFQELCLALMEAGARQPEIGLDIPDDRDQIWGEAELVWEDRKVAVVDQARRDEALRPVAAGWRVFVLEELQGAVQPVLDALEARGGAR